MAKIVINFIKSDFEDENGSNYWGSLDCPLARAIRREMQIPTNQRVWVSSSLSSVIKISDNGLFQFDKEKWNSQISARVAAAFYGDTNDEFEFSLEIEGINQ